MEVYVDDETKLTLHGLQQHYVKLADREKNRKLFDLLDKLEFNQVRVNLDLHRLVHNATHLTLAAVRIELKVYSYILYEPILSAVCTFGAVL